MDASLKKSGKKIEEYTADERAAIYLQSPYFIQKNKEAKEFLKRAGLPVRRAVRGRSSILPNTFWKKQQAANLTTAEQLSF